jgi:YD repeat-containing protein
VDVTVGGPGGTSATSAADRFTYVKPAAPAVTGLSVTTGSAVGGGSLVVTGSGFTGAARVAFGSTPTSSFNVLSDTAIRVNNVPAGAARTVDVRVAAPGGTSAAGPADRYTYARPGAPAVSGLSLTSGGLAGGPNLVVTGTGFTGASRVTFGGTAVNYSVISDSAVRAQVPAGRAGAVDVRVTAPGGTSAVSAADRFSYVAPGAPAVTGLSLATGSTLGGAALAVTGAGFTGATRVAFGSVSAGFTVLSDTAIQVNSVPAQAAGTVDVTVTGPGGTSAASPADQFAYQLPAAPVVTAVSPALGSVTGGADVVLIGTGFTASTAVFFGTTQASNVTVISDTAITARVPSHAIVTVYPVAASTVYRNADGTGAETTSYAYTYFPGGVRTQSLTVTHPAVSAAQDGPGTPDQDAHVYDAYGREVWARDGGGFLTYTEYDPATGAVTKTIQDVDTSRAGDFQNLPAGWATPPGGGLHLVTLHEVDALGRTTALTDPNGNVTYTVYNDPNHEVRAYAGWNAAAGLPTAPTKVVREDRGQATSYVETLTMSAAPSVTNGRPDGTEPVSGVQSLSRVFTSPIGHVVETDSYFNLDGVAYATDPYLGAAGTNYYATLYGYDHHGRLDRTLSPTGTIYRTVYDGLGRPVSTWVGTNDTPSTGYWSPDNNTPPSNMVQVTANVYDNGGVGDGDLTQTTQFPGGGAAPRVTQNSYDWRDRLVASKQGVQASEADGTHRPIIYTQYDNLNEVVAQGQYDGDGVTVTTTSGVPDRPAATLLRAKTTSQYDDRGRVFRTDTFSVDQTTGAASAASLSASAWYGRRGEVIKATQPGGPVVKQSFDGAGRLTATYLTDGLGDATWVDAATVANNNVLSQSETQYDADGNALLVVQRQRFHDEPRLGVLGDANSTDRAKARASYVADYYDAINRLTDRVDVGTNGGTAYARPATVPAGSDTVLVTHLDYNAAGWVQDIVDPRGLVTLSFYDLLGRATLTVENFSGDGTPTDSTNRTTFYTYDGLNHVLTQTAVLPAGAQTTQYVYGVTGVVNSNDLLASTVYPDNGQPLTESYGYDALREMTGKTDRNGTTHAYTYDVLGRQTADAVTALGAGVDGAVRRIETAYDTAGRSYLYTSFDAPSGGNIVNQVLRQYNGLGQLTAEYQSHTGAVNTASTPGVRYTYSEMAGGANHSRPVSMTYPGGRVLSYNYAAGLDDAVSRVTSLSDGTGVLEAYTYLGLSTVVKRSRPQDGEELTYVKRAGEANGDAGDQYTGLGRFGRVVDQRWLTSTSGAALDEYRYGYDRDGNRLYRENVVNALFSELYHYDGLNRLTDSARGQLNASHDAIASPTHAQSWQLDALGNWKAVTTDGVEQDRTHNAQNQVASLSGLSTPGYDANGNTLSDENGQGYAYDAWNRLVAVTNSGGTPLASYAYDGLNRRVVENSGTPRDLYYSAQWQVVEERVAGATQAQYVWSPAYVDALVARDGGGTRLYVRQDANWDVTSVADAGGAARERYAYDPYGKATFLDAGWNALAGSAVAGPTCTRAAASTPPAGCTSSATATSPRRWAAGCSRTPPATWTG